MRTQYNPELTPEPWKYRDLQKQFKRDGWSYDPVKVAYSKTVGDQQWITRLWETENGVEIDTHVLKNGKEMVA